MIASSRNLMLADHLRSAAARPFAWGQHDCCLFASDWVLAFTGTDPAAWFRGRYASEREAARFLVWAGGLAALMAPRMTSFAETSCAVPGDVGVIDVERQQLVAIRAHGGRWACLTFHGLAVIPARLIRGWSICRLS